MSGEVVAVIAGLVALSQGLVKIIEVLIKRYKNGKNGKNGYTGITQVEHDQLRKVYDVISRTDDQGSFLVYVPRSLSESQNKITDTLNKVNTHQEKTVFVLERLLNKIDKNG